MQVPSTARRKGDCCSAASRDPDLPADAAEDDRWPTDEELDRADDSTAEIVPIMAAGFGLKDVKRQWKKWQDKVFYDDILPPTGSQQISYARLMMLLTERKVKRIIMLADGKVAIVEVPVEGYAIDPNEPLRSDRNDPSLLYGSPAPEWMMEKNRYFCELPGDLWEDGRFMDLVRMAQPFRNSDNRCPQDRLLQDYQVNCELVMVDPTNQSIWLNKFAEQFVPIVSLLVLRGAVGVGTFVAKRLGKVEKDPMQEIADELGAHTAKEFNVGLNPKKLGVTYADVAGIDKVKGDIQVAMDMLQGDAEFQAVGAKPYRGILLEGPPGTGKTYLAKAMAGEAGVPFFSANGAEFVEMFQGVAAARIRSLFTAARLVAPAIVFIDEIDAIGKARGSGVDSGSQEREQGLLQLLTEMDGFRKGDKVLVVGATNRASLLDDALLRPGRFDRRIYMGNPNAANRFRILQVHARFKPIDRAGNEEHEEDAVLHKVAQLTIGYSGAELANLLNESSILAVRYDKKEVDLPIILEAMEKIKLGLKKSPLPPSEPKRRLATLLAARAVALTLTPGLPPIEHITILPRGGVQERILFTPTEAGSGTELTELSYTARKADGKLMGSFDFSCRLIVPLYAARCLEEVLYGPDGMTLSTSSEVAEASEIAHWLVRGSNMHPAFRDSPMKYDMIMGGSPDPTTKGLEEVFEPLTMQLLEVTKARAVALVTARLPVIQAIAEELITRTDEQVSGEHIKQLLDEQNLPESDDSSVATTEQLLAAMQGQAASSGRASFRESGKLGASGQVSFRPAASTLAVTPASKLAALERILTGRAKPSDLPGSSGRTRAEVVKEQMAAHAARQEAAAAYASSDQQGSAAPFPPPPLEVDWEGELVSRWVGTKDVVEV